MYFPFKKSYAIWKRKEKEIFINAYCGKKYLDLLIICTDRATLIFTDFLCPEKLSLLSIINKIAYCL